MAACSCCACNRKRLADTAAGNSNTNKRAHTLLDAAVAPSPASRTTSNGAAATSPSPHTTTATTTATAVNERLSTIPIGDVELTPADADMALRTLAAAAADMTTVIVAARAPAARKTRVVRGPYKKTKARLAAAAAAAAAPAQVQTAAAVASSPDNTLVFQPASPSPAAATGAAPITPVSNSTSPGDTVAGAAPITPVSNSTSPGDTVAGAAPITPVSNSTSPGDTVAGAAPITPVSNNTSSGDTVAGAASIEVLELQTKAAIVNQLLATTKGLRQLAKDNNDPNSILPHTLGAIERIVEVMPYLSAYLSLSDMSALLDKLIVRCVDNVNKAISA